LDELFSIENKVIVVTGGGSGIGEKLSLELAKRGSIVYSIDKQFKKIIKSSKINSKKCDIQNITGFKKICSNIIKKHKKIDVLINNAGVTFPSKKINYSINDWNKTLQVNLSAVFHCSQIILNHMKNHQNGSIINITSLNAELAFPKNPAYVASKGGLKMLTKALALDWGIYGIRVNNLGPGYIKTEMTKKSYSNKKLRLQRQSRTMLNRWGDVSDLIGPCVFLASDASKYITGQDIYVDGGWTSSGLQINN
jgi:NAD(P)-dependent dehydrogenase (short-subunit alcohol dehydrogenase family)